MKAIITACDGLKIPVTTATLVEIELENGDKFYIGETSEGIKVEGTNLITSHISTRQSPESVEVLLRG